MIKGSQNVIAVAIFAATLVAAAVLWLVTQDWRYVVPLAIGGVTFSLSPRLIQDWQRGILLRLGKRSLRN